MNPLTSPLLRGVRLCIVAATIVRLIGCAIAHAQMPPLPVAVVPVVKKTPVLLTPRAAAAVTGKIMTKVSILPPKKFVLLVWTPNYLGENEATVIVGTTDLSIPRSQWPIVFSGKTNALALPSTNCAQFFSAFNTLTNLN